MFHPFAWYSISHETENEKDFVLVSGIDGFILHEIDNVGEAEHFELLDGSGLTPHFFPLGVGTIGAGAAIPGPRGPGGSGGGGPGGPGSLSSPLSFPSSSLSPGGPGCNLSGVCGDVSFSFPLFHGR